MVIDFSMIDYKRAPILTLKNASGRVLGVIRKAYGLSLDIQYNEASTLEFTVPEHIDGVETQYYTDLVGMRIIELPNIGQFVLMDPKEKGDGIQRYKECKAYSLEYEWTRKKITISEGTYKFWDAESPENTILGMMMELVPNWTVGYISPALLSKYRTFSVSNESLFNFAKGDAQKSFNCLFYYDTLRRIVNVRDLDEEPAIAPVFLSHHNLVSEVEVQENTEDVVTRLDVSGADGVNIRDVNPCGTNKITRLGYYLTPKNVSQALIDKYAAWEQLVESNRQTYYSMNVRYALLVEQKIAENAAMTDLKGERTSLENIQAVVIEGIAQGLKTQADLDKANEDIADKDVEIQSQQAVIDRIQTEADEMFASISEIVSECSYNNYFTEDERRILDTYINDDEVAEATFVVSASESYTTEDASTNLGETTLSFNGDITPIENGLGTVMYKISGGRINLNDTYNGEVVSAILEVRENGDFVMSSHLVNILHNDIEFPTGCMTLTGSNGSASVESGISIHAPASHMYFTLNASEYEKRSVAWDLYEYGEDIINRISRPGYTFSLTVANFLSLEEFIRFKNNIKLGERIYVDPKMVTFRNDESVHMTEPFKPIFIGAELDYEDESSLKLVFSDSYISGESKFRLADLLDQSVSMGKKLDVSKYTYSAFSDSGASTTIREFMSSAFDVSKNAITSSSGQAPSMDSTGIRLRKWKDEARTAYEDEQIWLCNNSILMTQDNWKTAQMAIGKFKDTSGETAREYWGVVADRIAGTLIAGENLIIESAKKEGDTSVFRVDGDGVNLYNADISVLSGNRMITLNPDLGIVIGGANSLKKDDNGEIVIDTEEAKFWVDTDGGVHLRGTLEGVDGTFTGSIKITGPDGAYFQADSSAIGFFDKDNNPLLIQQGGAMQATVDASGSLTAGSWLYNSSGVRFTNPSVAGSSFTVRSNGTSAYCVSTGMTSEYGSDADHSTFIRARDTIFHTLGSTADIRIGLDTEEHATGSTDVSLYCVASEADNARGNIGTAAKPWSNVYCNTVHFVSEATLSSREVKQDIQPIGEFGSIIDRLQPVSFSYKAIPDKKRFGLIYEDTIDILPEICIPADNECGIPGINYSDLIPILLREIQDLRKRVQALESGRVA